MADFNDSTGRKGHFTGKVDPESGCPEGEGTYTFANGDVYTGSFRSNDRHGYGKHVYAIDGAVYEGIFRYNTPSGHGNLLLANGDRYIGAFRKGLYHGNGQLSYANGNKYTGQFKHGLKHGLGLFELANGDTWDGRFKNELPHGRGTFISIDGYRETSVFFGGQPGDDAETGDGDSDAASEAASESENDTDSDEEKEEEVSLQSISPRSVSPRPAPSRAEDKKEGDNHDKGNGNGNVKRVPSAAPSASSSPAPSPSPASASASAQGKTIHYTREARSNADFKELGYWDSRFVEEEQYDWLLTFAQVKPFLLPLLPIDREASILIVGCGNSTFSADLYDCGYENITNIDFSPVVIDKMREKNSGRDRMSWLVMDMTALTFPEGTTFDCVIDKAAMDALMVDEGDVWNPKDSVCVASDSMLKCVRALLVRRPAELDGDETPSLRSRGGSPYGSPGSSPLTSRKVMRTTSVSPGTSPGVSPRGLGLTLTSRLDDTDADSQSDNASALSGHIPPAPSTSASPSASTKRLSRRTLGSHRSQGTRSSRRSRSSKGSRSGEGDDNSDDGEPWHDGTGRFLQISFMQPHFRTKYLMGLRAEAIEADPYSAQQGYAPRYDWRTNVNVIDTGSGCLSSFLYVCEV